MITTDRAHAPISASAMKRRMNCVGSYALESRRPSSSSEFAAEGTVAHTVLEQKVRALLGKPDAKPVAIGDKLEIEGHTVEADAAMFLHAETAIEVIKDFQSQIQLIYGESNPEVLVEADLQSTVYPGLVGGHSDFIFKYPSVRIVMDYKYGAGVPVNEWTQLGVYAILSFEQDGVAPENYTEIWGAIFQPRVKDDPSVWVITADELREFRNAMYSLIPTMQWLASEITEDYRADEFSGAFKTGPWCQFCTAQAVCPAMSVEYRNAVGLMKADPPNPTLELLKVHDSASRVSKFLKKVYEELVTRARNGEKIPGRKLVDKWSNRQIVDEQKLVDYLKSKGHDPDEFYRQSLQTLEVLEKLVGKKEFASFVTRSKTGVELVPDSSEKQEAKSDADLLVD